MNHRFAIVLLFLLFAETLAGETPLFDMINGYRLSKGLSPLVAEDFLEKTADEYCLSLETSGFLSHRDSGGKRVLDRYRKGGGTAVKAGEILGTSPDLERMFRAWIDSPSHLDILTGSEWTRVGTALREVDGQLISVVLFSSSLLEKKEIVLNGEEINLILTVIPGRQALARGISSSETGEIALTLERRELPLLLVLEAFEGEKRVPSDFIYLSDNFLETH